MFSFLVLCCSWHADTCGSWLYIGLAGDVWLNKRDYLTSLLPLVSWHSWAAAALNTEEKRNGNTREKVKFELGSG